MRRLTEAAYTHYVARIGKRPAPMDADYDSIAGRDDTTLAWRGDNLVGMLVLEITGDDAYIENIAVSPIQQGSGLGTELLRRA